MSIRECCYYNSIIEKWAAMLPLAQLLAEVLCEQGINKLEDVSKLNSTDADIVAEKLSIRLKDSLTTACSDLIQSLAKKKVLNSNTKFFYTVDFASINEFVMPLYETLGSPNPNWFEGMKLEHELRKERFTTTNYKLETSAADEWAYVVDGKLLQDSLKAHVEEHKRVI